VVQEAITAADAKNENIAKNQSEIKSNQENRKEKTE